MATATGLIGVGVPPEMAKRTGVEIVSVTTTADTQNSAGGVLRGPGNKIVLATAAGAGGAVTLPPDAELGDEVEVHFSTNAGRVFPQTGGTLNQGTANQHVAVVVNASLLAVKVSAINWRVRPAGAVTPV
jgi:hypothetical protein